MGVVLSAVGYNTQLDMCVADGSLELKCTPENEGRVYRDLIDRQHSGRLFQGLQDIKCPVTVGCGGDAAWNKFAFLARAAPDIVAQLPNARLEQ